MADERNYFCLCENNCKFPTMTKEQILAAITQAIETGAIRDIDAGFVSRVVEQNKQGTLYFWVGTQAEYNALETIADDCHYIITDDTTKSDLYAAIARFTDYLETVEQKINAFGAVLFENERGVAASGEIKFDAGKHNIFAVTAKFKNAYSTIDGAYDCETTMICTKETQTGVNGDWSEGDVNNYISGGSMLSLNTSVSVRIDIDSKQVTLVRFTSTDDVPSGITVDGAVTKIVGLM